MSYIQILFLIVLATATSKIEADGESLRKKMRNSEIKNKIKEYQNQNDLQSGLKTRVIPESDQYSTEDKVDTIQDSILLAKFKTNDVQRLTSNYALTNTSNLMNNTFETLLNNSGAQYNYSNISHSINQQIPYFNNTNNYSYPYQYNEVKDHISQINNLNKSNYTNSSYIGYPQQKIYQFIEQNDEKNNNIIYNQTYPINNTNTTNPYTLNSSNSTNNTNNIQQQTTQQNNSTYYNNSSYQNTSTYSNNSNYYNNQTQQNNQTQYNNQTKYERMRNKLDQSRINLKLRNKINYVKQNNNFTQNITYYNQTTNNYENFILFNNSNVVTKQHPNDYYYYQNSTLITLQQYTDCYGNVYYTSLDYNYNMIITQYDKQDQNQEYIQVFGTITFQNNTINGNYYHDVQISNSKNSPDFSKNQKNNYNSNTQADFGYNQDQESYINISKYQQNSGSTASNQQNDQNINYQYMSTYSNDEQSYSGYKLQNSSQTFSNYSKSNDYSTYNYTEQSNQYGNVQAQKINDNWEEISQSYSIQNATNYGQKQTKTNYGQNNSQSNTTTYQLFNDQFFIADQYLTFDNEQQSNNQTNYPNTYYYSQNTTDSSFNNTNNFRNSKYIQNQSQKLNFTDQTQQQSYGDEYGSLNYYGNYYLNGQTNNITEEAKLINLQDENNSTTKLNGTKSSMNTSYYSYNDNPIQSNTNTDEKTFSGTIYDQSQFNQLRGSKKQISGGWKQVSITEMMNSNSQIIEQAIEAVDTKFNPQQEGYNFNQILSIQEQIVSGINYNIKLQYDNIDNSNIYEVIIYSIPWANQPSQITKCIKLEQESI